MRLYLTLFVVFLAGRVHAQSGSDPGEISTPATLPNPMDPNSDGWITSTGTVFTGALDETEFELPYIPIPEYETEPAGDIQVSSTSCTMYELASDATNGAESAYYYYHDPNGIPDSGDELVFFRFRVARLHTNTVALSILIDTDHTFGFAPAPGADADAVAGNPGFELEVSVTYDGGPDILVYNVDGLTIPSVVNASYPISTHLQSAWALNTAPDCSSRRPGFIDIYLPFSALGISSTTPIRMVGASAETTGSVLGGNADDIAGVDGNAIANDDDQFIAVIGNYPPFTFENGTNRPPSCSDGTVSIDENLISGSAVYTVSASDPDGNPLTYSITAGNTASAFAIGSSGQITVNDATALDFEVTPSFNLTVRASDGSLFDDATVTINLNDVNEIPSASGATVSLNENPANGTAAHTVSASDPDSDALIYTITGGNTANAFAINGTGQITVNDASALDFETMPTFTLTVRVSDGTLFDDAVITVNLNDVNEIPAASDATFSLDENSANATAVHTVSASDPDGDALTYTITGGNSGVAFAISGSGQITINDASTLDFETTPTFTLTVRVSDGTLFDDAVITINLNDLNETPVAADATVSLDENPANGATVHTVSALEPDGDALNYTITGGNTSTAFAINGSGQMTVNNSFALDFETTPSFTLTVRVSDGALFDDAIITFNLNNINETPVATDATVSLDENAVNGTAVNTVSASDPDGDALTYTITAGNTATAFTINSSGQITVNDASIVDFETTPSFALTVRVSDGALFDDATVTINLNDINETPTTTDATVLLDENSANGTTVYTVSASDRDGDALSYTIAAGNTATAFAINASGQITVNNASALDFETAPAFTLTVRVSDGTLDDDALITINLNDVDETPPDVNGAPTADDAIVSVNENSVNGTLVHPISASDPDDDNLSYTITGGNTAEAFAISPSGQISVNNVSALDFETTPSFTLTVRASDGSLFDDATITINLNDVDETSPDVNEAPTVSDATVSLDENPTTGTIVHTTSALDPDGDVLTYAIISSSGDNTFEISSAGVISINDSAEIDFETTSMFSMTVRVSDGQLFSEASITVNVRDINEPPSISDAVIRIREDIPDGTVVHQLVADDPDANDVTVFSIETGNVGTAFLIGAYNGEVMVNNIQPLDEAENSVYELLIMVTDAGGLTATATLTIEIENVDEENGIDPLKGFSCNGDGINDFWLIKGIEVFPDNHVKVFNRWGNLVYEARHYNNQDIAWRGESNGRLAGADAPETTYYFLITVEGLEPITGYVIMK